MNKPIFKYASVWGILGGTALAYLYLKTLGKGKKLPLNKTLLIGGSIGLGLGLGIDLATLNKKPITEEQLQDKAKAIGGDTEMELNSYLSSLKSGNISESDTKKVLNILNMFLSAKKDGKWDTKGDINTKKKVLISYGASSNEVDVFENTLKNHLTNSISNIIKDEKINFGGNQQQVYGNTPVSIAVPMFKPTQSVGRFGQVMVDPANR